MSEIINKPIGIRCADIYLRFPEIMEDECNDLAEFLEDEHIVYDGATDIFIDQKNKLNKQKEVLDKIKEMTKDLFETEYEGIYKKDEDNCCEKFYLLEELNKLLEEIE